MDSVEKRAAFEPFIPTFEGKPAVVVEFGPTLYLVRVEGITVSDKGVGAKLCWAGSDPTPPDWSEEWFASWELFIFDSVYWQVMYANSRVVFHPDYVVRTVQGDTSWVEELF